MRAALVAASVSALGLLAAACQTAAPVYTPLPAQDASVRALLHDWSERVVSRHGLRASARLSVDGTGRNALRLRVRQKLWLYRPNRLRVEIQSPLRTPMGVLVTDGLQYSVDTADGNHEMGSVHDALLWEVARLDLTPAEAVDVILGFPSVAQGLEAGLGYRGPDGGRRLDLLDAAGALVRQLDFDREGRLVRVETRPVRPGSQRSADATQVVEFSEYAPIDGAPFAHQVAIEGALSRATLQLSSVELNPELPVDTFHVDAAAPRPTPARGLPLRGVSAW